MRRHQHRLPTMRVIFASLILVVIACGALFGALNGERIPIDFYFAHTTLPAGVALIGALLVGWLLGGLVAWLERASKHRALRRHRSSTTPSTPTQGGA